MILMVLTIILCCQYYDTEDFSSISIIVMHNITIHDNIVILPSPIFQFAERKAVSPESSLESSPVQSPGFIKAHFKFPDKRNKIHEKILQ